MLARHSSKSYCKCPFQVNFDNSFRGNFQQQPFDSFARCWPQTLDRKKEEIPGIDDHPGKNPVQSGQQLPSPSSVRTEAAASRPFSKVKEKMARQAPFILYIAANSPATSTRCRADASSWVSNLNVHLCSWIGMAQHMKYIFG